MLSAEHDEFYQKVSLLQSSNLTLSDMFWDMLFVYPLCLPVDRIFLVIPFLEHVSKFWRNRSEY